MNKKYITKDSGKRQDYPSGMRRDKASNKPRFDLIWQEGLLRLAELYARGEEKYNQNDTPVTCNNWQTVVYSLCSCNTPTTTTKSQLATPNESTQDEVCATPVTPNNTQNPSAPLATQKESPTPEDCADRVITNFSSSETLNTRGDNEKTTISGWPPTLTERRESRLNMFDGQKTKNGKMKQNDTAIWPRSDSRGQMNTICSNCKGTDAPFVMDNQDEATSISTTITLHKKSVDCCAENATKGLECWATALRELPKHYSTCKIHRCLFWKDERPHIYKWAINNWQLANSPEELERFKASAYRHFFDWFNDRNAEEDHGIAAVWNIFAAEYLKQKLSTDKVKE